MPESLSVSIAKLGSRKGLQKIGTRTITPNDTPRYAPYIAFIIHEGGDGEKGKDDVVSGFHMRRRHVRVVGQSPLNDQLVIHMVEDHETTDDLRRLGDGRTKW